MTQTLRYSTVFKERPNFFGRWFNTFQVIVKTKSSIINIFLGEFSKIYCTKLIFQEVHFNCNFSGEFHIKFLPKSPHKMTDSCDTFDLHKKNHITGKSHSGQKIIIASPPAGEEKISHHPGGWNVFFILSMYIVKAF